MAWKDIHEFYWNELNKIELNKRTDPEVEKLRLQKEILKMQIELKNNSQYDWKWRIDYWRWIENLPENVNLKITNWSIYNNSDITKDYYNRLKWYILNENLAKWINQNESWYITLDFWRRGRKKINITYEWEHLILEYRWETKYILLKRENSNKNLRIYFWDNINNNNRWSEHWKFLEFYINLDWR